ncbi:MAG: phosphotransferase family protein [Spongiibacteraceae bacterium]
MTITAFPGLSETLATWIQQATGAEIVGYKGRAGGGASREGAQVDLRYPDGRNESCYLTHDTRADTGVERLSGFLAEASAIAAIAAVDAERGGMKVPRVIAYNVDLKVMLTGLVPGEASFNLLKTDAEREQVAFDFMRQLAMLHNEDVTKLSLQGFPAMTSLAVHLRTRIESLARKHAENPEDPLLVFALRWMLDHLPSDPARIVLVHGDAGPANFLYHEGKVTAVLDWEMTHLGDPMEDLAWIAIRDLFQPFVELSKCFAAYEAGGGDKVDLQRVRWYRTYALMTLVVDSYWDRYYAAGPFGGMLGNNLMYGTSHRRALIDGIAEYEGVTVVKLNLPECPLSQNERSFDVVLDDIRIMVPRIDDQPTQVRLKAMARVVKFWQSSARYSAAYDAMELSEINNALAQQSSTITDAKAALCKAIRARDLDDATIIRLLQQHMQREVAIMAPVMGSLSTRSFSPLE